MKRLYYVVYDILSMPLMYYIGKLNASLLNFVVCVFPCLYPLERERALLED